MSDDFDPYLKWLGIREATRPINHYRLLGLDLFEEDADVITMAADRQMSHIRTYQNGPNGDLSQQILNELARARRCLLVPEKKAEYDQEIRASMRRPLRPAVAAEKSELAPPMAVPPPTPRTNLVAAEISSQDPGNDSEQARELVPELGSGSISKSRKSLRKRNQKQMVWTLLGWASGAIAAVGIGAWLIGSGLLPNSKEISNKGPEQSNPTNEQPVNTNTPVVPKVATTTQPTTTTPSNKETNPSNTSETPIVVAPPTNNPPIPPKNPSAVADAVTFLNRDRPWNLQNLSRYPPPNSDVRSLLKQNTREISNGDKFLFEGSADSGGTRQITVMEDDGSLLVGFAITTGDTQELKTVQPIFLSMARKVHLGVMVGVVNSRRPSNDRSTIFSLAKPGYAVGELKMSVLEPIRCVRIKFMRVLKGKLDPSDYYWSDWIGAQSGPIKLVTNEQGAPVVGFHSRFDTTSGVATLGLVGAGQPLVKPDTTPNLASTNPNALDPNIKPPVNIAPPRTPGSTNSPSGPVAQVKPAIPSKRDIEKATDAVNREYHDSMAAIRTIRELRRVTDRMIRDGASETDNPEGMFARFEKARTMAVFLGDAQTAVKALRSIDDHFEIDFWDEVLDTIEDAELKANQKTQADFKLTMEELIDEAIDQQEFGPAGKLIANASLMAKRARDVAAQDKYKSLRKHVVELDKLNRAGQAAEQTLKSNPNDAKANLEFGNYLFVVHKDKDAAFACWAKSDSADLKNLVQQEASVDKTDGNQLMALASKWKMIGQSGRSAKDRKFLEQARGHYQAASVRLKGLQRKSAQSKVKELNQILNQ